ncbi:MAG TPA: hypothetical protein VIV64_10675 [Gammaproteobacteria bacterium]|jgi:hypothetical protein
MKRAIALALLLPTAALAQEGNEVSYDYFDFNYFRTDWDVGTTETDGAGWAGRFSVDIRDHVYLTGGYRTWEPDGVDGRSTYKRLGFGVHREVGERWSVYGEAGFTSLDLDLGSGNIEDDPAYVAAGARWNVADGYQLRLGADWSEAGKGTPLGRGESSITFGGDIFVTDTAAFTIEVNENDDNTTSFMLGLRFYHKNERNVR